MNGTTDILVPNALVSALASEMTHRAGEHNTRRDTRDLLTERLTFRARYGHGDELVALFKEWYAKMGQQAGMSGARVYTDATGPMFTVVLESDFADFAGYAAFFAQDAAMYSDPDFQRWFERMQAITETGDRQLFNMERLP